MNETKESFLVNRIKSVGFAFKGAVKLIKTEASIKAQAFIATLLTILGFVYGISLTEWMMQIFAIGLVMSIEGLNTAVEEIANFIHPEYHEKIGLIKDLAAGAVLIASIASIIVGLLIYIPKFIA